jgi:hypothetical protein
MSRTVRPAVKNLLAPASALFLLLLSASAARAASFQTFVSVNGNDANTSADCVRTSPCRLIKAALTVTAPRGVLTVLDSGGFGGFTVTQSVRIVAAPGVQATIVPVSPNTSAAVTVDAPGALVTLRGLYLVSQGPGSQTGLRVKNVGALQVQNCDLAGFQFAGLYKTEADAADEIYISDSVFTGCNESISLREDGSAPLRAVIERVRVEAGIQANMRFTNNVDAVVRGSVSSGRAVTYGVIASADLSGVKTEVFVEDCLLTDNYFGILAIGSGGGQAAVDVEGTTIAFNNTGLGVQGSGFINSRKDNTLRRNGTNGTFNGTFTPQ